MATWSWWDDSKWVPYPKKLQDELEEAFKAGKKKVKIDDDRFVDLKDSVQRRYDDPSKRRGVQREEKPPLDGVVVVLLGDFATDVIKKISDKGGLVSPFISPLDQISALSAKWKAAKKYKKPVLNHKWLKALLDEGKSLEDLQESEFEVKEDQNGDDDTMDVDTDTKTAKMTTTTTTTTTSVKNSTTTKLPTTSSSSSSSTTTTTLTNLPSTTTTSDSFPSENFIENTEWMGAASVKDSDNPGKLQKRPFVMVVDSRSRTTGHFLGILKWPSLSNVTTIIKGKIDINGIKFEEKDVIGGNGSALTLPCSYEGKIVDKNIKGTCTNGTFNLHFAKNVSEKLDLPFFRVGSEFGGVAHEPFPFNFTLKSSSGNSIRGELEWTTLDTTTSFVGNRNGNQVEFQETGYVEGDSVPLMTEYKGEVMEVDEGEGMQVMLKGKYLTEENVAGPFHVEIKDT